MQNIERVINDLRTRRREVRAELNRLVELVQGLVQDDQAREREERSTAQLTLLRPQVKNGTESQG